MRTQFRYAITLAVVLSIVGAASAQTPASKREVVVTRAAGGSIQTKLSANIVVNEGSTVTREFLVLHDPSMPADVVGTPGVTTVYVPDRLRGEYQYQAKPTIQTKEALSAVEVRFLLFDIWGQHVRTLLLDDISDMSAGSTMTPSGQWRVLSENEVSRHYASIGYISRVRTQDGRVLDADPTAVIREAQKFSKKFAMEDLEPERDPAR
jgi:hypothetical protein